MKNQIVLAVFTLAFLVELSHEYSFHLGPCPIIVDEPCRSNSDNIMFKLSSSGSKLQRIEPLNLQLPVTFNMSMPVKMIIHGYGGLVKDTVTPAVTRAYKKLGYNIIVVDWERLSVLPCYPAAALNTFHVGQCVALMAVSLASFGVSPDLLHAVGFSLGAHIASFASNQVRELLGLGFGRITGLDPALPLFATWNNDLKLDYTDADFVDVIHTSAGTFGKIEAAGHVDFYVNGGTFQPACSKFIHAAGGVSKTETLCSHRMAGQYFAESIIGKKPFIGNYCRSMAMYSLGYCKSTSTSLKAEMGEHCPPFMRGIYFVDTASSPPYALG